MIPSVGRIVHITLSDNCAANITRERLNQTNNDHGNPVAGGQIFPMIITKVWNDNMVQGQIFLDGNDTYWASSVEQGTGSGQWYSPVGE
jgi:hypothetical protein